MPNAALARPFADPPAMPAAPPSAYQVLTEQLQHIDTQILATQRFHLAALGVLCLGMTAAALGDADGRIFIASAVLALAGVAHWALLSTKLTLQKLCWTQELRAYEIQLFPDGTGPFTRQKVFFDDLASQPVGWFARLLFADDSSRQARLFPMLAILAALLTLALIVGSAV